MLRLLFPAGFLGIPFGQLFSFSVRLLETEALTQTYSECLSALPNEEYYA